MPASIVRSGNLVVRTLILVVLLCVHFAWLGIPTTGARSGAVTVGEFRQEDQDNDGRPDTVIMKGVALRSSTGGTTASPGDEVRVYDGARNMQWGQGWESATDFTDDAWVFDINSDGTAQMLLQFTPIAGGFRASIYADNNGDGVVSYQRQGSASVRVTESGAPLTIVEVRGGWYLPNGQLNWNVHILSDGRAVEQLHTYSLLAPWRPILPLSNDGQPEVDLEFHDADADGIPEYGLWRLLAATPRSSGAVRSWVWSNEAHHRPAQPDNFIFWPYLSSSLPGPTVAQGAVQAARKNYFDTAPQIAPTWNASQSGAIQLYIAFSGYPIEEGYHINNLQPILKGQENYSDFENVQAYYDLAGNHDGVPELHIRRRYFAPFDVYGGGVSESTNEIRYSWNQYLAGSLSWDYKVGLAGRQSINSTVAFQDFSVEMLPYQDFPKWVTSNRWDWATFVAREGAPFLSTEGIYAWPAVEQTVDDDPFKLTQYLAGEATIDPETTFQEIQSGFRGEYAPLLEAQPNLYFSPIDHKLHLLRASHGVWNSGDNRELRYDNLDGDPYIDQWRYLEGGILRRQLNVTPDYLVLSDNNMLRIKRAAVPGSLFESLPPADHDEWLNLGSQLEHYKQDFGPGDLGPMFEQFSDPEIQLTGGRIQDFRLVGQTGFRFVLSLESNHEVRGEDLLGLAGKSPGDYAVTYDGQRFSVESLTPPSISATLQPDLHVERQYGSIAVSLLNSGGRDLRDGTLELWAERGQQAPVLIGSEPVTLLADKSIVIRLSWAPPVAGTWRLTPRIRLPDGTVQNLVGASVATDIGALSNPPAGTVFDVSVSPKYVGLLVGSLIAVALTAAIVTHLGWKGSVREDEI